MIERLRGEIKGPLHLTRCFGELALMYCNEKYREFVAVMDDALDVWGEDD